MRSTEPSIALCTITGRFLSSLSAPLQGERGGEGRESRKKQKGRKKEKQ